MVLYNVLVRICQSYIYNICDNIETNINNLVIKVIPCKYNGYYFGPVILIYCDLFNFII